ncbi:MAG: DUF3846 domain-containing protein [Gemmiger formicilis]|uniref:DUF3846 domain-containing protein n=1 Tax=Gemmiger formicilis TaxID=745368 RepID=UPI0039A31E33
MVNTIWKENFLIMCSKLCLNARDSGHFAQLLLICRNYSLQTLCGAPHNVCNDNGIAENLPLNRMLGDYDIIHGTFFVCGLTSNDFTDLTPQADEALRRNVPRPAAVFPAGQDPVCGTHYAGRLRSIHAGNKAAPAPRTGALI